ncbi:MAG: DNA repair protein RecN [Candidatus Eremiobacteraeota bacterium]|nr:DNA repair protein RecN [Candidatus Eremiobacteraeota bacterium]
MLRRLVVDDFELIAHAELEPAKGLTAITGETGSGKTMLLGAIDFVLGARASADAVRSGRTRARVALEVEATAALVEELRAQGIELDAGEDLVIVRELAEGKTGARIDGMPASAGQVRALAPRIAEVVGQHEAQRLLVPSQQLDALDRFAGESVAALRRTLRETHARCARLERASAELDASEGRALAEADYAAFAAREIGEAALEPGEDERLRERREVLANAERIATALRAAHDALSENEGNAADALGAAFASLAGLGRFGDEFASLSREAAAIQAAAGELASAIARRLESIESDPRELDAVTSRLELIERLKKKYGGTLEAVFEAKVRFDGIVAGFANVDERKAALRREREAAEGELVRAAGELSKARRDAARACEKKIAAELRELAMPAARFEIAFEQLAEIGPGGAERCEFRLAPNPGELPRALARSASGGELSRVMLALTVVLADRSSQAALVFDEIDAGVGGATANAVGARLADLARDLQVVCVTHLAQIAAFADEQVALQKREEKGTTTIELVRLDAQSRLAELARMLSGTTTGVSLQHARTLLKERRAAAS